MLLLPFITNGGDHSPEDWAMRTAAMLFPLDKMEDIGRRTDALRLQANIADALAETHGTVQRTEYANLAKDAAAVWASEHDVAGHVDAALGAVLNVAQGTPWQAHWARPDVQVVAKLVLADHFATSQHNARHWHADRNPSDPAAKAFKARFNAVQGA